MEKEHCYSDEKNAQIVIALLKAHGIRRIIASPGNSHLSILGSVQFDDWFEIFSAIDERHAAYMACGMAEETGEPVVLCCTGSTASRNYVPALTEAYYRKLPILAITAAQPSARVGNLWCQCIDRSIIGRDIVNYSTRINIVKDESDSRDCALRVNKAILELSRRGGCPVHIDLETVVSGSFTTKNLPPVTRIERHLAWSKDWPEIQDSSRVAILIGAHRNFSKELSQAIDRFVGTHNVVVFSGAPRTYCGKNRIAPSLVCSQVGICHNPDARKLKPSLVIYIGEGFNDYTFNNWLSGVNEVWRVSEDGEMRDRYGHLTHVFEIDEAEFFNRYSVGQGASTFYESWLEADREIREKAAVVSMPFSNPVVARAVLAKFPDDAVLHLGVSSTYQHWNMFLSEGRYPVYANVGCCGIDGCVSAMIGGALTFPNKLHIGVFGDLTFFYDMNSIGNRHIGKNVRIILINNGVGALFHQPNHVLGQFGDDRKVFFGAEGHFGCKSPNLVKHMSEDIGFQYRAIRSEEELSSNIPLLFSKEVDKPVFFECFTDVENEHNAWNERIHLDPNDYIPLRQIVASEIKRYVPNNLKNAIKSILQ